MGISVLVIAIVHDFLFRSRASAPQVVFSISQVAINRAAGQRQLKALSSQMLTALK